MTYAVAVTGALILSVLVATRAYSRDDKYVLPIKAPLTPPNRARSLTAR
jgi:hypothetical protein